MVEINLNNFTVDELNYHIKGLDLISTKLHLDNQRAGWWNDPATGELLKDNPYVLATKLALVHSEVSEALEGLRKGGMDDKLPQYTNEEVEIADIFIRLFDYCGARDINIGEIIQAKLDFNKQRADHKVENRIKRGGKKF